MFVSLLTQKLTKTNATLKLYVSYLPYIIFIGLGLALSP